MRRGGTAGAGKGAAAAADDDAARKRFGNAKSISSAQFQDDAAGSNDFENQARFLAEQDSQLAYALVAQTAYAILFKCVSLCLSSSESSWHYKGSQQPQRVGGFQG